MVCKVKKFILIYSIIEISFLTLRQTILVFFMSDFRLKVFRSAARHLSFTKAAEELCLSQPSVTRHVRELETEYGVRLFERTGGRLLLTQAGEHMMQYVERILETYTNLEYEMKQLSGEGGGVLRLGASTTIAQYVLPKAVALFAQKREKVAVQLHNANTEEVEKALLAHEIDLGFVEGGSRQRILNYQPMMKDELVAVVRAGAMGRIPEELSPEELAKYPLVLREPGSGTREVLLAALQKAGVPTDDLQVRMQLGSSESIKGYLLHADAIGFVSVRAVRQELAAGVFRLVEINGLELERSFSMVALHGTQSGLAADFAHFLQQNIRQFL